LFGHRSGINRPDSPETQQIDKLGLIWTRNWINQPPIAWMAQVTGKKDPRVSAAIHGHDLALMNRSRPWRDRDQNNHEEKRMSNVLEERGSALENEYFHRKERELIEKMKTKLAAEEARETQMNCPRCDGKLVETDYESIKIDVCERCSGVWFDAGELAQVVDRNENSGWLSRFFN